MPVLPTVSQFPTFVETFRWLRDRACQCIWYLPDKGRFCLVGITDEVNQSTLDLADSILRAGPLTKSTLQVLADIAEQSCCRRHHSNKMWGSGLAEQLAVRWQKEIQVTLTAANSKAAQIVKLESVPLSISTFSESSSEFSGHTVISSIAGHSDPNSLPADQPFSETRFAPLPKPVMFARHEVLKGETILSKLLSPIDPQASTTGFLYIFTYTKVNFEGKIKIGYTSNSIDSRLEKWAECGQGNPTLLASFDNVRHPERVEVLTHFELLEHWYAQRWCEFHRQAHIEWFKTDTRTASSICRLWSQWMECANPYDRRGYLKAFWKDIVEFLNMHRISITAEVLMEVQGIEEGSIDLLEYVDDDALRKQKEPVVKQEQLE